MAFRGLLLFLALVSAGCPGRAGAAELGTPSPALSASARRLPGPLAADLLRIIDGDTFEARIRIWFGQDVTVLVRIAGIDAPELAGGCEAERVKAERAGQELASLLLSGRIVLRDLTLDKYGGRVVARVFIEDDAAHPRHPATDAAAVMLAGGHVRPYAGKRRAGWCALPDRRAGLNP